MAKIAPLTPDQAKATLAARLGRRVDRVRQIATRVGVRPYRVFLVWTQWTGVERGEGEEKTLSRVEILPTPRVRSLDAISLNPFSAGVLPVGSLRVDRISTSFTFDQLTGRLRPGASDQDHVQEPIDFYWEVHEDGRADRDPLRMKFRVLSPPVMRAGSVDWVVGLERVSEDPDRQGNSQIGNDTDD